MAPSKLFRRVFLLLIVSSILIFFVKTNWILSTKSFRESFDISSSRKFIIKEFSPINRNDYPIAVNFEQVDWTDYEFVKYEMQRVGPGEGGKPVNLKDPEDARKQMELVNIEGMCGVCSDKISVNRSVPDTRPQRCKGKTYLKHLYNVSIIVIFNNEYQSVLYRTIHSIFNRTPMEVGFVKSKLFNFLNKSFCFQAFA